MRTRCDTDCAAILREVTSIFRSVFEDPFLELTPETTSDDLPAWDSMNHITVVVEAECRFDIQFETAEIEQLTSVRDLVRMIQAKRAQAKRAQAKPASIHA